MVLTMSSVHIKSNRGPKMHPSGTPKSDISRVKRQSIHHNTFPIRKIVVNPCNDVVHG